MVYGDYNGPNKADKGIENGSCNRTRCQCSPARWYNHGSYSWYCDDCRHAIEFDSVNYRAWQRDWLPRVGHPQFETRQMMDALAAIVKASPTDGAKPDTERSGS